MSLASSLLPFDTSQRGDSCAGIERMRWRPDGVSSRRRRRDVTRECVLGRGDGVWVAPDAIDATRRHRTIDDRSFPRSRPPRGRVRRIPARGSCGVQGRQPGAAARVSHAVDAVTGRSPRRTGRTRSRARSRSPGAPRRPTTVQTRSPSTRRARRATTTAWTTSTKTYDCY